ncbi:MAG: hypothetical protein ISR99_01915 [Parcubacteria group bacterium]|nr:hypothetical protein [Parcubacteria group bacterium]
MIPSSKNIYIPAFLILLFLIGGYVLFQSRNIIIGPVITLEEKYSGRTLNEPLITIKGSARNISHISLNDNPIFTDESGHFEEELLVSPGYSIITIKAIDRFDRVTKEVIELTY